MVGRASESNVRLGECKPFTARPVPQTGKAISVSDRWASEQFEELERVLREQRAQIEKLQGLVGDGSWDG